MNGETSADSMTGPRWNEVDRARLQEARCALRSLREDSVAIPVLQFLAFFGLYVLALGVALSVEPLIVSVGAALVMGFASAKLFLIGHDAAHGSYAPRPLLNATIGRAALLPSLHAFTLWQHAHRVHHRYTNLRHLDFVWTPLSKDEFERLGTRRRALYRAYRNELCLGLGLYYLLEIWLPRMIVPRRSALGRRGPVHWLDASLVVGFALGLVAVAAWAGSGGHVVSEAGSGALMVIIVGVVPLLYVQWMIGLVVFFNHTHPEIPWFASRREWSYWMAQLRCTAHQRRGLCPLLPDAVMNHAAHHADPSVPLRRLHHAQSRLATFFGEGLLSYRWSGGAIRGTLRTCKLYDYARHRWLDFAGNQTAEVPFDRRLESAEPRQRELAGGGG